MDGLNEITEVLKNNPNGMSVRDIAKAVNMNRVTAARYLDVLRISGRIEMIPFGQAKVFYPSRKVPFFSLIDYLSDIVLIIDRRGKIRQLNIAFLQLFGGRHEDYYGLSVYEVLIPGDNDCDLFKSIDLALRGKETAEEIAIDRNDDRIHLKVKIYPSVFESGEPSVSIIMTDITGIMNADEFIRVNTDMMRKISSTGSIDGVLMAGAETALFALKAGAAAVFIKNSRNDFSLNLCTGDDHLFRDNLAIFRNKCDICERIAGGMSSFYSKSGSDETIVNVLESYGLSSLSANPLFRNGEVAGFLATASSGKEEFTGREMNELELISYQISGALEKSLLCLEDLTEKINCL
ncbi:MAG: PAS domain S-box protein [Methanomicrobiaceae archaeon]|nr:PAS domain S-box protein [Methanomicrobiaceae archaeon]